MKAHEIREKSYVELSEEVKALKSELFKLRFKAATNRLENPMKLSHIKKDIARIKTIMTEMKLKGVQE